MLFVPVGFYFCLKHKVTHGKLFIALYGLLASYFACVMVRLMLIIAPAACVLAAIGISQIFRKMSNSVRAFLLSSKNETVEDNKVPAKDTIDKKN